MKACVLFLAIFCMAALSLAGEAGVDIRVSATAFRNDVGKLLASLHDSADGFPETSKKAVQNQEAVISNKTAVVAFTNVVSGTYAVALCHDENANGKMDHKFYGPPKEGYGVSGEAQTKDKRPGFDKATFLVGTNNLRLTIEMTYSGK